MAEMFLVMSTNPTAPAFVSGVWTWKGNGRPSRRRRPSVCPFSTPRPTTAFPLSSFSSPRSTIHASSSSPQPPPSSSPSPSPKDASNMTTSKGFALQEADSHTFEAFKLDEGPFQTGGAYAISDASNTVVYMGYTKNIASKLKFHQRLQPSNCVSFRVYVPPVPPELMSPDMLESVLEYWVRENGAVPRGNTIDRALWEQENPIDRKVQSSPTSDDVDPDIPVRQRSTTRRTSTYSRSDPKFYSTDPFSDAYRSSTPKSAASASRRRKPSGWDPTDEDYVQVDVDPFDPFSAASEKNTTRQSWAELDENATREDWYPIFLIMGFGGIVWIFGLLSNALPAATPSLGM